MMNLAVPENTVNAQPAAPQAGKKIMPLGDSITSSEAGRASYRYWLDKKLHTAGIPFDFVGSLVDNWGGAPVPADFDRNHEGHSGFATRHMANPAIDPYFDLSAKLTTYMPDMVLLHLGTNDVGEGLPNDNITPNLDIIIGKIRAANPNATIFLAQIIPQSGRISATSSLNQAILTLANLKNTTQSRVIAVDQFTGFNSNPGSDTYDGVHPNESGEIKMATRWFDAIFAYLFPYKTYVPAVVK